MQISSEKRPLVVLTDYQYDSIQPFQDVYDKAGFEFRAFQCRTAEEIIEAAREADAVQVHFAKITKDIIEKLPKCRVLVRSAVGMDTIDIDAATAAGLPVCNVPDYGIEDVSTHAILMMLAITKKINILTGSVKEGIWDYSLTKPVHRLNGQVFGLMGCGAIARCTARKAQAFGMKVVAYDPYLSQSQVDGMGITLMPMEEVAAQSDVLSIHLPLTKETEGLINRNFFAGMKKSAYLVNTARGGVICEDDLVEALKDGMIAGAGLDVLCDEKISKEHPLMQFDNVIITPHAAWYSEEAELALLTGAAEEVVRGLRGERLKHPYNRIMTAREV